MSDWFERVENDSSNVVYSRVRLSRNWDEYAFPSRLMDRESRELVVRLEQGIQGLGSLDGHRYESAFLSQLRDLDKEAHKERRILNSSIAQRRSPTGLVISDDESASLVLNGEDHIRMQFLAPGLALRECWQRADKLDDYINERFSYAFDDKYGYLTTYPTNMGTGMKASVVIHMPTLSTSRKFNELLGEMSRFGTTVRGVYGQGSENYGALYEIYNQKTLGQSEQEIIDLVEKVALQLTGQENQVRKKALENHRLIREDEIYKSYGVLKYARRLTMKDAMTFLSQIMAGFADGLIESEKPCHVYRLMLGIQPANLQLHSSRPLGKDELETARAEYLRNALPELKM